MQKPNEPAASFQSLPQLSYELTLDISNCADVRVGHQPCMPQVVMKYDHPECSGQNPSNNVVFCDGLALREVLL